MALTLAQAIVEVRGGLNEVTEAFFLDTEITSWLQEGTRIFSCKTLMVEDTQDLDPLIAGQLSYTSVEEIWIADILEPYAALYFDGTSKYKGLVKIHPRQLGNVATFAAGAPKYYCLHNRTIYLWPLTTAAIVSAGGVISFLFAKETDDITELKDEFQHLPIIYATGKCKQKDQKFAEGNALISQFYGEVNFERQDKHARETDSLDKFKIPRRGGGPESARG